MRKNTQLLISLITITGFGISAPLVLAAQYSQSAKVDVVIGNPPAACPSGWPIATGNVTQGHDSPDPVEGHARLHPEEAIDIAADTGTPVVSTFNGTVVNADSGGGTGYGVQVRVSGVCNGVSFTAIYAHLQAIAGNVQTGTPIKRGDPVGWVDTTGHADGPHLHYSFIGLVPEPPYIPKFVPPLCGAGNGACNVTLP